MSIGNSLQKLQDSLGEFYLPTIGFFKIVAILLAAVIIVRIGSYVIRKVCEKQKTFRYKLDIKRLDTMCTLMASVFRYGVYLVAFIIILTDIFQLKSILAAAGVGGVALGLGAQSLIKDIISGSFIIMEDQFAVGDWITIDTMNGFVEEMELRITKIRSLTGDLYIIPNGEIKRVTNHTRGNKTVMVDIPLAYSTDLNLALEAAGRVCEAVAPEFKSLVEVPKVLGITEMGKDSMNIRIIAKAPPIVHWEVERRIRHLIKEEFSRYNLEFFEKNRIFVPEDGPKGGDDND